MVCGLLFDREAERKVSEWQGTLDEQHPETQPTPVAPKVPSKPWTGLSSTDRTRILTSVGSYMRDQKFRDFDRRFYQDTAKNPRKVRSVVDLHVSRLHSLVYDYVLFKESY